ncbi:MAG TPA: DUF5947 family protein [Chthoniobacterales bacterium]
MTPEDSIGGSKRNSFAALRRFSRAAPAPAAAAPAQVVEQCELCNVRLPPEHRHMLEMATRKIVCACDSCTMTFVPVVEGRFKVIPRDARALPDFQISDADWENLSLPINLAFFFFDTPSQKMTALYPSPAGATESLLPLTAWETIVRQNSVLQNLQPDVEALLVNRANEARDYYLAPIDKCFELVGLIRMNWRGFSGGEEVWNAIGKFFETLKETARA